MTNRRNSERRWRSATRMLSVACFLVLLIGCAHDVVYLRGTDEVVHLEKGRPAPHAGWLVTDERMAELYDLLELQLEDAAPHSP